MTFALWGIHTWPLAALGVAGIILAIILVGVEDSREEIRKEREEKENENRRD
jgi:mannose/fructose/N-acetylgalactosamine-specific phosphotransferase system component IIC